MSEKKQELLKFIKESNWEELVGDDFIRSSLESIIKYVTSKKGLNFFNIFPIKLHYKKKNNF
jgi:hypothetical protein